MWWLIVMKHPCHKWLLVCYNCRILPLFLDYDITECDLTPNVFCNQEQLYGFQYRPKFPHVPKQLRSPLRFCLFIFYDIFVLTFKVLFLFCWLLFVCWFLGHTVNHSNSFRLLRYRKINTINQRRFSIKTHIMFKWTSTTTDDVFKLTRLHLHEPSNDLTEII